MSEASADHAHRGKTLRLPGPQLDDIAGGEPVDGDRVPAQRNYRELNPNFNGDGYINESTSAERLGEEVVIFEANDDTDDEDSEEDEDEDYPPPKKRKGRAVCLSSANVPASIKKRVMDAALNKCWLCGLFGKHVAHVIAKSDKHLVSIPPPSFTPLTPLIYR